MPGATCGVCRGQASLVLGQPDFITTDATLSPTGMRNPTGIATDGNVVVVGRKMIDISKIVEQTLAMGLLPALFLSITGAAILSIRAQRRVEEVNERVQRIVAGDLRQRLPTRGSDDSFDKLASIVNGMLANIESLSWRVRVRARGACARASAAYADRGRYHRRPRQFPGSGFRYSPTSH